MKNFYTTFFCLSTFFSIQAQQSDPEIFLQKKNQLIEQYTIYESDHRGLVIYFSDQTQIAYPVDITFNTLEEAFTYFFSGGLMKDIICITVSESQTQHPSFIGGLPLDMNQSIQKYIELFQTH